MKLRQLRADDLMIQKETVDSLTEGELQGASQARGMKALGVPAERLKSQLEQVSIVGRIVSANHSYVGRIVSWANHNSVL